MSREVLLTPASTLAEPTSHGEIIPVVVSDGRVDFRINTYAIERPGSENTAVLCQPWGCSAGIVQEEGHRTLAKLFSEATDSNVLVVDNLGVGNSTSKLSREMFRGLLRGEFDMISRLMWAAIEEQKRIQVIGAEHLTFGWYSQGTAMAAELLAHAPKGVRAEQFVALEAPAPTKTSRYQMSKNFLAHGRDGLDDYFKEGESLNWRGSGRRTLARYAFDIVSQIPGHLGYGLAMPQNPLEVSLAKAVADGAIDPDSRVCLINGSGSYVSPTASNERLAYSLGALGLNVLHMMLKGETHGVGNSPQRVAQMLGMMKEFQSAEGDSRLEELAV